MAGLGHESIARDALTMRGRSINVQFDATKDKISFTKAGLASYDVLIFLMNTGEVRQYSWGMSWLVLTTPGAWGLMAA